MNMEAFLLSGHVIMWNKAIELSSKSHPGPVVHVNDSPMDERKALRTWEEELTWAALQQKNLEELLRHREQELAEWEIDILEWELNIILHQLCQEKPRLKKRMGKFRTSRLKLKNGNHISLPSGHWPGACWKDLLSSDVMMELSMACIYLHETTSPRSSSPCRYLESQHGHTDIWRCRAQPTSPCAFP
ncbi:uncharacterized protein LOC143651822 isoform X7 [Tamandua tetradactyla]|uniref:uncharacterized protein LOC143651822 isoform X7 n=1 Tax=Tamandua tetradactyla TaxID=48850 RepID=UPI004053E270